MNAFYAIVAALFAGFLFVFCLQILLFVVLDLSIESGATSFNKTPDGEEDNAVHWGTVIGVAFALISFSHYFAEALVIAGAFIADAFNDHPLSRTFIFKGSKHGFIIIEWLFLCCFFLFPIIVGSIALLAASDHWWYYTSLSWFILVMVFFVIFCACVVFYEVRHAVLISYSPNDVAIPDVSCNGSHHTLLVPCVLIGRILLCLCGQSRRCRFGSYAGCTQEMCLVATNSSHVWSRHIDWIGSQCLHHHRIYRQGQGIQNLQEILGDPQTSLD